MNTRQAADTREELAIRFGKIGWPASALTTVSGVAPGGIAETGEGPFGFFVGVGRDRGGVVFFAGVFLKSRLEGKQCRKPAAQQDREYRNAEAHGPSYAASIADDGECLACRPPDISSPALTFVITSRRRSTRCEHAQSPCWPSQLHRSPEWPRDKRPPQWTDISAQPRRPRVRIGLERFFGCAFPRLHQPPRRREIGARRHVKPGTRSPRKSPIISTSSARRFIARGRWWGTRESSSSRPCSTMRRKMRSWTDSKSWASMREK